MTKPKPKPKSNRGGARPGAGRPKTNGPTLMVSLRLKEENALWLKSQGVTATEVLNRIVDAARIASSDVQT